MSAEGTAIPILMPRIGHAMEEGTVVEWHRADGDRVGEGETVVTIETDKANYDIESPAAGTLHIHVQAGEEVKVETLIGQIGEGALAAAPVTSGPVGAQGSAPAPASAITAKTGRPAKVLATPKARRLAAELGVDLATVNASAQDGVISAEDVQAAAAAPQAEPATAKAPGERVRERRKLTGMRKTAARRLTEAWQTIPHIVQMVDVDANGLQAERARLKADGQNVSLNDLILHAAAQELIEHPELNATVEGDEMLRYGTIDAGLAVDTPRGLVVPVVRDAGVLSLQELSAEMARLIEAARAGRLPPVNIGGASLTVSSLGAYGIRAGTPVINLGEPLLIFVGAIEERPVVQDGRIVARPTMTLSTAYDHRVTDGLAAAQYSQGLKRRLEALGGGRSAEAHGSAPASALTAGELESREVRAVSEAGYLQTIVQTRRGDITIDEPPEAGGNDSGPTPVEAFLGALASCMAISFKYFARRKKLRVDRVEAWVQANPSRYLERIVLELEVWSPEPQEAVEALLADAKRGCFVSAALNPEIAYEVDLFVHAVSAGE